MNALTPFECTPRISPELAAKLVETIDRARGLGIGNFQTSPAITIHVWPEMFDKEITNEADAEETIERLTAAISKKINAAS